jgi:hypothetical protein
VVLDSADVSRQHAEIIRTPADRWVLRDLGSTNGTFVNGKRVPSCALAAEDVVEIGPVTLRLGGQCGEPAPAGVEPPPPRILVEDFGTEVFYERPRIEECTTQPYPKRLDPVKKRLSELTDPRALRGEVCRALAQGSGTAAAIFRVSPRGSPLSGTPDVLAYHFGHSGEDTLVPSGPDGRWHPSHGAFRVSRRLLEAVRKSGRPLMSKSIFSCDTKTTMTIMDPQSPRALLCVPMGRPGDALDLLYVDVPIDDRMAHGPEEMFAFVQAVARHATAVLPQA